MRSPFTSLSTCCLPEGHAEHATLYRFDDASEEVFVPVLTIDVTDEGYDVEQVEEG